MAGAEGARGLMEAVGTGRGARATQRSPWSSWGHRCMNRSLGFLCCSGFQCGPNLPAKEEPLPAVRSHQTPENIRALGHKLGGKVSQSRGKVLHLRSVLSLPRRRKRTAGRPSVGLPHTGKCKAGKPECWVFLRPFQALSPAKPGMFFPLSPGKA